MLKEHKSIIIRLSVAAVLTLGLYFLPTTGAVRLLTFAVPYLIAGYDVLLSAGKNIFHGRLFDEEFLMVVATLGAFAVSEYVEAAAVMVLYQVGELFSDIASDKSRRSIKTLMDIRPDSATVIRNSSELTVSPEQITPGEVIVVRPGEKIPLDGIVCEGTTTVNTAALTGESLPADKTVGDSISSGCINLSGVIRIRVTSAYGQSTIARILELVETSAQKKSRAEGFITRFSQIYTPCVVGAAVMLAVVPPLVFSGGWLQWLERALIFLVVSCPCALVVSVPLTFFCGMGGASRLGILIKGGNYLDTLSKIDTVVFDKTGTLTKGCFSVEAVHPSEMSEARLLDIAAAIESFSSHPVAESIVAAHNGHIDRSRISDVTELAGMGLSALLDGRRYSIGNAALMEKAGIQHRECHHTGSIIHICDENSYLGHIVINDSLKEDSVSAVRSLKSLGIKKTVMLTGDNAHVAERIGTAVGIDEVHSSLLPGDKVSVVEKLIQNGRKTAFVGDGINDAPVLMRADVGIAMGAIGSDAAIESADIVLMDDKPSKLVTSIRISRRTMRLATENICAALAVKAVVLGLSAVGIADMWTAVFADVGILILLCLNATRAMIKPQE